MAKQVRPRHSGSSAKGRSVRSSLDVSRVTAIGLSVEHHTGSKRVRVRNVPAHEPGPVMQKLQFIGKVLSVFCFSFFAFTIALLAVFNFDEWVSKLRLAGVREVVVRPEIHYSAAQILETAGLSNYRKKEPNFWRLPLDEIDNRITDLEWVYAAEVKRLPNRTLSITIVEEQPIALVRFNRYGEWLVNKHGVAFKKAERQEALGLPLVEGLDDDDDLGDARLGANETLNQALDFIGAYRQSLLSQMARLISVSRGPKGIQARMATPGGEGFDVVLGENEYDAKMQYVYSALAALKDDANRRPRWIFADNRKDPNWITVHYYENSKKLPESVKPGTTTDLHAR